MNTDCLKFRVWDKTDNKYDSGYFLLNHNGILLYSAIIADGGYPMMMSESDTIIERCTGLIDKNGKLIYQGDIVEVVYFDYEGSEYTMQGDIVITKFGVMLDHVKGEHFKTYTGGSENVYLYEWLRDFVSDSESQIEIIGNIHESKRRIEKMKYHSVYFGTEQRK